MILHLKRIPLTAALLLLLAGAAVAQTISVAPDTRYNAAIVPGSIAIATLEGGQVFTFGTVLRPGTNFRVFTVPNDDLLRTIQIQQNRWMLAIDATLDGVTGLRFIWPGHNAIAPLNGVNTPAPAKPTITPTGAFYSFQFRTPQNFNGSIAFGDLVSIITISIIGSDFGSVGEWIIRFEGVITVEVPAQAIAISQAYPANLLFQLGRLPSGSYVVSARAQSNPSIASNSINLIVE